jgi:hypothetical protein
MTAPALLAIATNRPPFVAREVFTAVNISVDQDKCVCRVQVGEPNDQPHTGIGRRG